MKIFFLFSFFASLVLASELNYEEFDPSIWSVRTWIDDLLDNWTAPTPQLTSSFQNAKVNSDWTDEDYELKNQLISCIKKEDWNLFEVMLQNNVQDWQKVPDFEEVVEAVVQGRSVIIYDLFLNDERIGADQRIMRMAQLFYSRWNSIPRIANALESNVFGWATASEAIIWQIALELFTRKEELPHEWYIDALPDAGMLERRSVNSSQLIFNIALNPFIPKNVLSHVVNDTHLPLTPLTINFIDGEEMEISLHALADIHGNRKFCRVLMESPKYWDIVGLTDKGEDELCKLKIRKIWRAIRR